MTADPQAVREEVKARYAEAARAVSSGEANGCGGCRMSAVFRAEAIALRSKLDPRYVTIQLDTLMKAARAVGQNVRILFEPLPARSR